MIYTELIKLQLIASIVEENDADIQEKIEEILLKSTNQLSEKFADFSNILSEQELDQFERNIEEGCGTNAFAK
jgi:acetyl-CoA carboxylase alpha subunit